MNWKFTRSAVSTSADRKTAPILPAIKISNGGEEQLYVYMSNSPFTRPDFKLPEDRVPGQNSGYYIIALSGNVLPNGLEWSDTYGYDQYSNPDDLFYQESGGVYRFTGSIELTLQKNGKYTKSVNKDEEGEVRFSNNRNDQVSIHRARLSETPSYNGKYTQTDVILDPSFERPDSFKEIFQELWSASQRGDIYITRSFNPSTDPRSAGFLRSTTTPFLEPTAFGLAGRCDLAVGIEPLGTSPVEVGVEFALRVNVVKKSGSSSGEVALTVALPKGVSYVGRGQAATIERAGDTTKLGFSIGSVKSNKTLDIKVIANEESRPAGSIDIETWKSEVTANVASKAPLIIDTEPGNNTTARTLNIKAPAQFISFNGYVGDIIKLELANRVNGRPFKLMSLASAAKGRLVDEQGGNVSIGRQYNTLYFVPAVNGETPVYGKKKNQPATGNLFFDVLDNKQTRRTVKLSIVDGYSGSGGANPVTFGIGKLDVYRQEQRLAYLGYPRKSEAPLIVNGRDDGNETSWARALFDAVIEDKGKVIHPIASISSASQSYLNSANAPRWQELGDGAIPGITIKKSLNNKGKPIPQTERWATDWAWNVLKNARANYGKNLTLTAGSLEPGGAPGSGHASHGAGRDLDIDTPPPELLKGYEKNKSFFAEVARNGEMYVLALPGGSQRPIPSSKPHIIVKKQDGSLGTALITPDSLKIGLKGSELFNNQVMLSKARDFLLDNTNIRYDLTDVRRQVKSFLDTGMVTRVLNNDPRLWTSPDGLTGIVRYSPKHNGHVHYDIAKPSSVANATKGASLGPRGAILPALHSNIPGFGVFALPDVNIASKLAPSPDPAFVNGFTLLENVSAFI